MVNVRLRPRKRSEDNDNVGLGETGFDCRLLNVDQGLVSWPALGQLDVETFSAATRSFTAL